MDEPRAISWREIGSAAALVFLITAVGCGAAFAVWLSDLHGPQIAVLGSGDRLSVLVVDGPARLVIATGDDPIGYENALTRIRPIFARRVDVLLVAGSGENLLVPLAAHADPHTRTTSALAPLPASLESEDFDAITTFSGPRRIQLSPAITVTAETQFPFGADPATDFPAWRVIIQHGQTRVVVLSDGDAAALFPPANPASIVIVSGPEPAAGWTLSPAPVLVTSSGAIGGPDLRAAFTESPRPPRWGYRVFPGEALRFRFVPGGIEIPSESAHDLRVLGDG